MDGNRKRPKLKKEQGFITEKIVKSNGGKITRKQHPLVPPTQLSLSVATDNVNELRDFSDRMNELILPEQEIMVEEPTISQSAHQRRKEEVVSSWASIMPAIKIVYVVQQGSPSYQCCPECACTIDEGRLLTKCEDCNMFMCSECVPDLHQYQPFHTLKVWDNDGYCKPFSYKRVLKHTPHHCSGYIIRQDLEIIDERGKIFLCSVERCSCQELPVYLITRDLWPSSPKKPSRAYHQGFLRLLTYLMLEGHMSLKASCQSFMWINNWTTQTTDSIYRQLLTEECFEEYRHFQYQMRTLGGLNDENQCPACPQDGGKTFLSLDANFGLVRKNNAGTSIAGPKHGTSMFMDDNVVSSFVDSYNTDTGKSDNYDCSQFQAGDSVRSKNKALQLDKTGVFGSVCKHGFPIKFVNMEHGERYAYPVLMLKTLVEEKHATSLTVFYDIACKLKAHLKNTGQKELLNKVTLALPCWHAYGHSAACQVNFSTRTMTGCGLTDGEEMERVWSYLRPFAPIGKEMTPSHRVDLLTDALLHYGKKKAGDIVEGIKQRQEKATLIHQQATMQLKNLIQGKYNFQDVRVWKEEEKDRLKKAKPRLKLSWSEQYVSKLQSYQYVKEQLAVAEDDVFVAINQRCESILQELVTIEESHRIQKRWQETDKGFQDALEKLEFQQKASLIKKLKHDVAEYHFMLETKKKYSDGQSIATRIKKQLEKTSQCVNNTISRYNNNNFKTDYILPRQILRKDALNVDNDMYFMQEEEEEERNHVTYAYQHKAVQLLNMAQRAEEEMALIEGEKKDIVRYYQSKNNLIDSIIADTSETEDLYKKGLLTLMLAKKQEYEGTLVRIRSLHLYPNLS